MAGLMVTLATLRDDAPDWEWRAERSGFGWIYVGTRAFAEVTVRAYGVLAGPGDDDIQTQWRAEEGRESRTLLSWLLTHGRRSDG